MSGPRKHRSEAPLLAWGDTLRAEKSDRAKLHRRMAAIGVGIAFVLTSAALPPAPRLLWNASASAPIGLYSVAPGAVAGPGDMVVVHVPARFRTLAAARGYLPANVPLVKRVAGYAGDEICALGSRIFVNGAPVAERRATDGHGRAMPAWQGCVGLRGRQLFLLMDSSASFDGRYFGVTDGGDVIGKATLLWRR